MLRLDYLSQDESNPTYHYLAHPEPWAESMEAESCAWLLRCQCGHSRSVWEFGGIRWLAKGKPRKYGHCPKCGQSSWMNLAKEAA